MHCLLLVEAKMEPIPDTITVKHDWGEISIHTDDGSALGRHVLVEGTETDLKAWMAKFNGVWVGHGAAQFQQFSLMHTKD